MKETYIGVMHDLHDRVAAKVLAGEVRDDFAGLGLSQKGDGALIGEGESEVIIQNLDIMRRTSNLYRDSVLSKGLVFEKTLFFNMLRHAGEFVAFRHINSKGETHSVPMKDKTETHRKTMRTAILHFLAAAVIGGLVCGLISRIPSGSANDVSPGPVWPWIIGGSIAVSLVYLLLFERDTIKIKSVIDQWAQVQSSGDRQSVINFLWPNGQDAEFGGNMSSWNNQSQVRCRIRFPERSSETNEEIARIIAVGLGIHAKPLIVAHYKAIGIEESSVVALPADPFICLETPSSVIVFPHTVFGGIAEEGEMIERLKKSFASLSFHQQN